MSEKAVNLILLSYGLEQSLYECIARITSQTQYPHRLIIGDNLSPVSDGIRQTLRQYVQDGTVDRAYFFEGNYILNSYRYMFENEIHNDYVVLSDADLLLPDCGGKCWLEKIVHYMEICPQIVTIGFRMDINNMVKNMSQDVKNLLYRGRMGQKIIGRYVGISKYDDINDDLVLSEFFDLFNVLRTKTVTEYFKQHQIFWDTGMKSFLRRQYKKQLIANVKCFGPVTNASLYIERRTEPDYFMARSQIKRKWDIELNDLKCEIIG